MVSADNYLNMLDFSKWKTVFEPKNLSCLRDTCNVDKNGKCLIDVASIS